MSYPPPQGSYPPPQGPGPYNMQSPPQNYGQQQPYPPAPPQNGTGWYQPNQDYNKGGFGEKGGKFNPEKPRFNDIFFAILFLAQFAAYIAVSVICLRSVNINSGQVGAGLGKTGGNSITLDLHTAYLLCFIVLAALFLSMGMLATVRSFTRIILEITLVLSVLLSIGYAIYLYIEKFWSGAVIATIFAVISILAYFPMRRRIPFSVAMLQLVFRIAKEYPSTYVWALVGTFIQAAYSIWWSFTITAMYQKYHANTPGCNTSGGSCGNGAVIVLAIFLVFSFYWTSQFITNLFLTTEAGIFGTWYASPPNMTKSLVLLESRTVKGYMKVEIRGLVRTVARLRNGKLKCWTRIPVIGINAFRDIPIHPALSSLEVLFPEGGGQPSDAGKIVDLSNPSKVINVRQVMRRSLDAIHFCDGPIEVGTEVRVEIDAERRWDLMMQHTGQHVSRFLFYSSALTDANQYGKHQLLSGILEHDHGLDTGSWSLSPFPNPSYIELPRAPTQEEIVQTMNKCNAVIREGRRVSVEMSLAETDESAKGAERPESMPEDYQGGVIRTVVIHDLDRNPCCGTHVPTLSLLQSLYILPTTTSVRGTNARLYFLVGPRVLANLAASLSRTRDIALEYGCQAEDVVERTKNLVVSSKESRAKEKKMGTELAEWVAKDLLDRSKAASADAKVITGFLHRDEDGTNDLEWLVALSGKIKGILDTDTTSPPHLFALAASSSQSGSSLLIFGQPESLVASAGNDIRAKFGARVKGGGKGRWQGKLVEGRWKKADEETLRDIVGQAADSLPA